MPAEALHLLIVDDSRDDAVLVQRALAGAFGAVRCRHVQTEAGLRDALRSGPWHAVLCDHGVPGLSTVETLAAVRRARPDTPFLVVSGQTDPDAATALLRAGADDWVPKDRLQALPQVLRRALAATARRGARTRAEQKIEGDLQRLLHAMRAGHVLVGRVLAALDTDTAIWRAARGLTAAGLPWAAVRVWRTRGAHLERWTRGGGSGAKLACDGEQPAVRVARGATAWVDDGRTLTVPLHGRAAPVGALELDWAVPSDGARPLGDRVRVGLREVASAVAGALALTLEIHELLAAERVHARRDPLTGLPNRRALQSALKRELARARRGNGSLTVLAIDADRLKPVNDTWGHAVGDLVLHALARLLLHGFRVVDLVARTGGDEFVVVMPGVTVAAAAAVAERLRTRVERFRFPNPSAPNRPVHLTISVGVCALAAGDGDGDAILGRADAACYEAKAAGRNRVVARGLGPRVRRAGP